MIYYVNFPCTHLRSQLNYTNNMSYLRLQSRVLNTKTSKLHWSKYLFLF